MFLDLQFSLAKFLELLGDQVQRGLPLSTKEFAGLPGQMLIIDHLDVTELELLPGTAKSVSLQGLGGTFVVPTVAPRIRVTLDPALTTVKNVVAAGHLGTPTMVLDGLVTLFVDIDISAVALNGSMALQATPIALTEKNGLVSAADAQAILSQLTPITSAIDLPEVAGSTPKVINAGLSTHSSGVVGLLAELGQPSFISVATWQVFFSGNFSARSGDWSMVIPDELLATAVDAAITDAVDAIPDADSKIEVVTEPVTSWTAAGAQSTAVINAVDACPVLDIDIAADLNFSVTFGLKGGDLVVTVSMTWDLHDWDVFKCGLATAVLPGLGVTLLGAIAFGPVGAVVGIVLTIVAFIAALVVISDQAHGQLGQGAGDVEPGSFDLKVVEHDDDHAVFRGSAPLELTVPGMVATAVSTGSAGLTVSGTLDVTPHEERSLEKVGESGFTWNEGYSCSSHQWTQAPVDATLSMFDPSKVPLLVQAQRLNDPSNEFDAKTSTWGTYGPAGSVSAGFKLAVHPSLPPSGADSEVLIWTNSGVRYANFGHIGAPGPPPSEQQLMKDRLACFKPQLRGPKKWLEAHWLVDPPYDLPIERVNVWELTVRNLAAGTPVELALVTASLETRVLTSMRVGEGGTATFRLATKPGLHLAVNARGLTQADLFVGGAGMEAIVRFAPRARLVDAALVGGGPASQIALAMPNRVMVLGLDGRYAGSVAVAGIQGIATIGSTVFAHDGRQVVAFDAREHLHAGIAAGTTWRADEQIRSIQHWGRQLVVETASASVSLDERLRPTEPSAARGLGDWSAEPWLRVRPQQDGLMVRADADEAVVMQCAELAMF